MAIDVLMPKLGLTMTEGTVQEWYKQEGDAVQKGDVLCVIASEKLTMEVEAEAAGFLTALAPIDEEIVVKGTIAHIVESLGDQMATTKPTEQTVTQEKERSNKRPLETTTIHSTAEGNRIFITPLARRLANEHQIDRTLVRGTGGNGRITKLDIERVIANGVDFAVETNIAQAEVPATSSIGANTGEGLEGMRQVIAQRMHHSVISTAQLTLHRKASLNALIALRQELKEKLAASNIQVPITYTVFVARAVALALRKNAQMNSTYENGTYKEHDSVHLGIATAVRNGLLVPVIRNAQQLSLSALAEELGAVTEKARDGEKGVYLSGSTFTITNLGTSGIEYFTPILNTPETGILGLGAMQKEVALDEQGTIYIEQKMPLSLTFDHQVIDGKEAAEFLADIVFYLENPMLLMI